MTFRPTIVAMPEYGSSSPYIGFPLTEIPLQEPGGADASNPHRGRISVEFRDKIIESTSGSDVSVPRRKLAVIELPEIDFVTAARKAEIERLIQDARPIWFCPNVGPFTRWSFPLQRSVADFLGRKAVANTRTGVAYHWDDTDRLMRSWAANNSCFLFRGAWSRFLRTTETMTNRATKPHPDSSSHGWATIVGSPVLTYTESVLTPVLARRGIANGKGVVSVYCPVGGSASTIAHASTGTVSGSSPVGATVVIAHQGTATFMLMNNAGTVLQTAKIVEGDGTFQIVRLTAANATAETSVALRISFDESTTMKQAALIGPIYLGNCSNINRIVDWNDSTVGNEYIAEADTVGHLVTDFCLSWFQLRDAGASQGVVAIGNTNKIEVETTSTPSLQVDHPGSGSPYSFSNPWLLGGVAAGEWAHFVLQGSADGGLELFVNGNPHANNGVANWEPADLGYELYIGRKRSVGRALHQGGISHLRLDTKVWTDQEIIDHRDTYFADIGRGIVEPVFGRVFRIENVEWAPRFGSDAMQWIGALTLVELGPDEDLAGMIRQEGDV